MSARRVLVCGGRDYANVRHVHAVLSALHAERPIGYMITGGAPGADLHGARWAMLHDIGNLVYPADWQRHGRAAGPIRNQRMIDEGKPDLVVAFPGGKGTADMVRRARKAGVKVLVFEPATPACACPPRVEVPRTALAQPCRVGGREET